MCIIVINVMYLFMKNYYILWENKKKNFCEHNYFFVKIEIWGI